MTANLDDIVWTVESPKVVAYLLNRALADGASKAKYLLAFGYSTAEPERLARDLVKHGVANWPGREGTMPVGLPRIVFEGPVEAPDTRFASLHTVWEITSPSRLRFLTAVPLTRYSLTPSAEERLRPSLLTRRISGLGARSRNF